MSSSKMTVNNGVHIDIAIVVKKGGGGGVQQINPWIHSEFCCLVKRAAGKY